MKFFKAPVQLFSARTSILLLFVVFIGLSACKKSENKSEEIQTATELASEPEETVQQYRKPSCKYIPSEQTDEFIRGITELEGYEWDDEQKIAQLVLNDHWSLSLKRGGCDYFELSATFIYDRPLSLLENKEMIFEQVLWITGLIQEFDSEQIAEAINQDKLYIQEVKEGEFFINFMDERLYEYYQFTFKTFDDYTNFKIGKYLD